MKYSTKQFIKILQKNNWFTQGFNGTPFYMHIVASTTGWMTKEFTGKNYSHFFLSTGKTWAEYSYDYEDLKKVGEGYFRKNTEISRVNKYIQEHKNKYLKSRKDFLNLKRKFENPNLKQLILLGKKGFIELSHSVGLAHSVEAVSYVSEIKLKEILENYNAYSLENMQLLSHPVKESFLADVQKQLDNIKKANKQESVKLAKKFLQHYSWIENSYVGAKQLSLNDVLERANKQKGLINSVSLDQIKKRKQELIKKLNLNKQEIFVIKTIEVFSAWQDDRKKFIMQAIGSLDPIMEQLADKLEVNSQLLKYLCPQEFSEKYLLNKKFVNSLSSRFPRCCYYALKSLVLSFPGKQAEEIDKNFREKLSQISTELKGMIACTGKVTGVVKVCRNIHDIPLVKKGEILVTSMTRPEFLPAMQKAAAFVTDEGGITSHAAIVSREMNKPCIIGTKIATKVFKDGDLVEVDANKGIVRKIK